MHCCLVDKICWLLLSWSSWKWSVKELHTIQHEFTMTSSPIYLMWWFTLSSIESQTLKRQRPAGTQSICQPWPHRVNPDDFQLVLPTLGMRSFDLMLFGLSGPDVVSLPTVIFQSSENASEIIWVFWIHLRSKNGTGVGALNHPSQVTHLRFFLSDSQRHQGRPDVKPLPMAKVDFNCGMSWKLRWKILVSWDHDPQYMEKKVPNNQHGWNMKYTTKLTQTYLNLSRQLQ